MFKETATTSATVLIDSNSLSNVEVNPSFFVHVSHMLNPPFFKSRDLASLNRTISLVGKDFTDSCL
ncbi:hypothetical protein JCM19046_3058 [Bacillus sp. JCM 19046]|nr:hypothetical protein JCM19046_3058 [Bacillus sp. JCM 19046]